MKFLFIDKIGAIGTLVTAMACPACWPLFATVGSALGLGILLPWEGILMNFVFPTTAALATVGSVLSFRSHKKRLPLIVGLLSGAAILLGFYVGWQLLLMYIGIFGLLISSILGHLANRQQEKLCKT